MRLTDRVNPAYILVQQQFGFFFFNSLKPDALQLGRSGGGERRCLKFATRAGAVRGAEEDRETQAAGFPGGSGPAASRSKTHILLNTLKTSATDAHCIVLKGQGKKKGVSVSARKCQFKEQP